MVYERVRGWTSGRSLPVQNFVKYPEGKLRVYLLVTEQGLRKLKIPCSDHLCPLTLVKLITEVILYQTPKRHIEQDIIGSKLLIMVT